VSPGDLRRVPAREGSARLRERASRFLAFARRVSRPEDAREFVAGLERRFHDATHVCYAWRIGASARAADAGEPAGSAGKPILGAIEAARLDEACVAVVRYFGGTKLGTAGLARCYRDAARLALEQAGAREVLDREEIEVVASWDRIADVRRLIDPPDVVLLAEEPADRARLRLGVRRSLADALVEKLRRARAEVIRSG
jgi:uncharacterized YigZ family protein